MEDVMVICKKCGNKVPASYMKLDIDEKMVICPECIKNKGVHKEIEKEVFHKDAVQDRLVDEPKTKVVHKCTSCGFRFKIDIETKVPRNCPYCNARVLSL